MSLADVRLLELPSFEDDRGILTAVEACADVPFEIRRVFFLHGVRAGASRAGHAHRWSRQLLVPVAGHFRVEVADAGTSESYQLADSHRGLFIPPLLWVSLDSFSANAVCLVLTDTPFDAAEYIRDWNEFVELSRAPRRTA
jgi:dTDP-4-dehydrorhamnose 3,5-epimerase-like enzyme